MLMCAADEREAWQVNVECQTKPVGFQMEQVFVCHSTAPISAGDQARCLLIADVIHFII